MTKRSLTALSMSDFKDKAQLSDLKEKTQLSEFADETSIKGSEAGHKAANGIVYTVADPDVGKSFVERAELVSLPITVTSCH